MAWNDRHSDFLTRIPDKLNVAPPLTYFLEPRRFQLGLYITVPQWPKRH